MHILYLSLISLIGPYLGSCAPHNTGSQPMQGQSHKPDTGKQGSDINNLSDIDAIIKHQDKRFAELETILKKDSKYSLRFPGNSTTREHYLGAGIAKGLWAPQDYDRMNKHISQRINELRNKYPGRIFYGKIGDYNFVQGKNNGNCDRSVVNTDGVPGLKPDGTFIIHIWGANAGNFNYPLNQPGSFGGGQASCFEKQRPGVFGISTMPPGASKAELFEDDKLLSSY